MTPGTSGQPLSCAVSWGVARLWQPLARPTLARAEAPSSWTMSSAEEMRAPCYSALISAGMSTTVTTARMPVSCASHCEPAGSALHIISEEPLGGCPSFSRIPSYDFCSSWCPFLPLHGGAALQYPQTPPSYCVVLDGCHLLRGPVQRTWQCFAHSKQMWENNSPLLFWGNSYIVPQQFSTHIHEAWVLSKCPPTLLMTYFWSSPPPQKGLGCSFYRLTGLQKVLGRYLPCWVRTWTQMVLG